MKLVTECFKGGHDVEQLFEGVCNAGHRTIYTVEDLEQTMFVPTDLECATCEDCVSTIEPETIAVECLFCSSSDVITIGECGMATHYCLGGADIEWKPAGSPSYFDSIFSDPLAFDEDPALAPRADYWEVVVHYTQAKNFVEILRTARIDACPTGYFGGRRRPAALKALSNAVCLTEAPLDATDAFAAFGPFGLAFEKQKLLPLGAGPALNVPEHRLREVARAARQQTTTDFVSGFHKSLLPFINKIGTGFSFLAEREWRVPKPIPLAAVKPWLVLPDDYRARLRALGATDQELFRWISKYRRLRLVDDDHPLW